MKNNPELSIGSFIKIPGKRVLERLNTLLNDIQEHNINVRKVYEEKETKEKKEKFDKWLENKKKWDDKVQELKKIHKEKQDKIKASPWYIRLFRSGNAPFGYVVEYIVPMPIYDIDVPDWYVDMYSVSYKNIQKLKDIVSLVEQLPNKETDMLFSKDDNTFISTMASTLEQGKERIRWALDRIRQPISISA